MSYGIRCKNDVGHVILSSDMYGMHYAGDATFTGVVSRLPSNAIMERSGGTIKTSGNVVMRFTFTTNGTPLVFIKPAVNVYYAILTHKQSGNVWTFDVIQEGDAAYVPRVLVFTTVNFINRATSSNFGIETFMPDGSRAFDSRLGPLGIYAGGVCTPPSAPPDDGATPDAERYVEMGEGQDPWPALDWAFTSTRTHNSYGFTAPMDVGDVMFSAPSLAQSCWVRKIHHHWYDSEYDGDQQHHVYRQWWVFYRSAFRIRPNGANSHIFDAGWIAYACGYSEKLDYDDSWFGGGGDQFDSGPPPFSQKTINLSGNAFIIGNASNY